MHLGRHDHTSTLWWGKKDVALPARHPHRHVRFTSSCELSHGKKKGWEIHARTAHARSWRWPHLQRAIVSICAEILISMAPIVRISADDLWWEQRDGMVPDRTTEQVTKHTTTFSSKDTLIPLHACRHLTIRSLVLFIPIPLLCFCLTWNDSKGARTNPYQ